MNILLITSIFEPYSRGGTEVFVSNLVSELKKSHSITILTICRFEGFRSLFPRGEIKDGVRIIRFYPLNVFSFLDINEKPFGARVLWSVFDFFNLHSLFIAWRVLKQEKIDVVMTHGLKGITYGISFLLRCFSIPHMHTPHDVQLVEPSGRLYFRREQVLNSLSVRLYSVCTRLLFGSPTWVVYSSRFLERFYAKRGFFVKSKKEIIRSPLPPDAPVSDVRSSGNPVTFLYVGQLEEPKGIHDLIEAFGKLKGGSTRLIIMGNGSLREKVRIAASHDPRIAYVGYRRGLEKFEIMQKSDFIVVCSTIYENSPSVIYEAFSLAIPVIAVDLGGAGELIRDGVNGFLYQPGDVSHLLDALVRAQTIQGYEQLSRHAKESVGELNIERYVEKLCLLMSRADVQTDSQRAAVK